MRFITFTNKQGEEVPGVVSDAGEKAFSLKELGYDYKTLLDFIPACTDAVRADLKAKMTRGGGAPLAEVRLQAPIPHPRHDILCIGQNYVAHALESAKFSGKEWVKPDYPVVFSKRVNRAVGPDQAIPAHAGVTARLDYEVELAVVIGKTCRAVRPEDVPECIFGYTIVNDMSARDLQQRHAQWSLAKGLDGFAPMGPWIVTRDKFAYPPHLNLKTRVNGEVRQDSNTNDLIFDITRLISEISAGITLEPGDIISTGTPAGVGMGFQPPKFLKAGDVIECEVEGIGMLRNKVE